MSKQEPGIQRPVIDGSVHPSVHSAMRNIYDNLFHQKDRIDQNSTAIADNQKANAQASPTQPSGTYFPTLFNSTNLDSSTPYTCQWARIGNCVIVSGRVDVNPTAAATTLLGISLPIPSNLQFNNQLGGTAACPTIAGEVAPIAANTGNNYADMSWVATNTSNYAMFFMFMYLAN